MKDLSGKTAFITGGASGIGLGMARAFGVAGMRIAIADIEPATLESAKTELTDLDIEVSTFALDVSDRTAVKAVAATAEAELGPVHILCTNAGVPGPQTRVHEAGDADWDWTLGVNFNGVINCVQAFAPGMIAHGQGGHIVNTASIAGVRQFPGMFPMGLYVTSKYGVVGLSEAMAVDFAAQGIGVSVLCPDMVDTRLFEAGRNRPDRFGGQFAAPVDPSIDAIQAAGLAPDDIGARVRDAVENDEFYIFTHPENRAQVEARHAKLMAAFDALDAWRAEKHA